MAYLALYRRFRPTDFNSVIGQEPIVKTLKNQIIQQQIGHAYLFCGARGTGKTSLAKIFARAVNCESHVDGSPCGKCSSCLALKDPSNVDVIEIDAASNNKVENVRDIRDNVQYPPVSVRYKVYIIDEVHMLTTEAFNALLKTLEEPPKHAIFLLATTEPHKLPATILSRCMRFDFRLIPLEKIVSLIKSVYDEIGKSYDEEAVKLIAKSGEGSVRDALSVADLCVSLSEKLTYSDVLSVLGATDVYKIDSLVEAIFSSNVGKVLSITDELSSLGKSVGLLSKDIVNYFRDLAVIKTCENAKEILALPEDRYADMKKISSLCDNHKILRCVEIVSGIETQLRYSTSPRAVLETALIKASMPEIDYNIDALLSRISALEDKVSKIQKGEIKLSEKIATKEVTSSPTEDEKEVNEVKTQTVKAIEKSEPISVNIDGKRCWGAIVRKLRITPNKTILWVACQEMTASVQGTELTVFASNENEKNLLLSKDNFDTLLEIARGFGIENIKVCIRSQEEGEAVIDKAKAFFGDALKIDN